MLVTPATAARHETPNAVMRTLAARSIGAEELAVWDVAMRAGKRGPRHVADREQVWVGLAGDLAVQLDDERVTIHPGDALRIPAGAARTVEALTDARALVASGADPHVTTDDDARRPVPWAQ